MAGSLSFLPTNVLSSLVPSTVTNAITGLNNTILNSLPEVPQYFFSIPFPNNQPVLYELDLNPGGVAGGAADSFIFPLTPSSVSKQVLNLTNYFDVRGGSASLGVQRIIDQYGLTPPIITISGTTGFQFHSLDKYQWSGRSSFARLVNMIQNYAQYISIAANSQQVTTQPTLTFYDGFTGEVYNVVPIGSQGYSMDNNRPIYQVYNLQFVATASQQLQAVALADQDPINVALLLSEASLQSAALTWWNSILQNILPGALT